MVGTFQRLYGPVLIILASKTCLEWINSKLGVLLWARSLQVNRTDICCVLAVMIGRCERWKTVQIRFAAVDVVRSGQAVGG